MECEIGKRRRNKVTTGDGSSRYIPEEIIVNIVGRLPIKARGQFRCVSKQWCTLIPRRFKLLIRIDHEYFNDYYDDDHTSFTSINQKMDFCDVVDDVRYSDKSDFCDVVDDVRYSDKSDFCDDVDDVCYSDKSDFCDVVDDVRYSDKLDFCHIMGSCNGLVLVEKKKDFFLWNPSTGYFGEKLHSHNLLERYCHFSVTSGLCFDSKNGDYKALIASYRNCDSFVVVGSFKTKTWIPVKFSWENVYSIRAGPVLNDCLHLFVKTMNDSYKIVYFDPKNNEFVDVPTPDLKRREIKEANAYYVYGLCALDGYLCMVCNLLNRNSLLECKFEILIMKEYGVKESWEILFKIEQGVDDYRELEPLLYTDDKEKVIIRTRDAEYENDIKAFDKNGKLCSNVKLVEFGDYEACPTVVYEETLTKPTW